MDKIRGKSEEETGKSEGKQGDPGPVAGGNQNIVRKWEQKQEILGKNRANQGINPGIYGTLAAERWKQKRREIARI